VDTPRIGLGAEAEKRRVLNGIRPNFESDGAEPKPQAATARLLPQAGKHQMKMPRPRASLHHLCEAHV
jgi:hypothetical protein